MANQGSRRLVIDADVVHSAGETEHPVSSACRRFLETVLDVGHQCCDDRCYNGRMASPYVQIFDKMAQADVWS